MSTSTSIDTHVRVNGVTPKVKVTNWGSRITLRVEVGESSMTWYLSPLTDESTNDYAQRVIAELSEVDAESYYVKN